MYPAALPKCSEIVGRAVVIIVTSRAARKTQKQSAMTRTTVWMVDKAAAGGAERTEDASLSMLDDGSVTRFRSSCSGLPKFGLAWSARLVSFIVEFVVDLVFSWTFLLNSEAN